MMMMMMMMIMMMILMKLNTQLLTDYSAVCPNFYVLMDMAPTIFLSMVTIHNKDMCRV